MRTSTVTYQMAAGVVLPSVMQIYRIGFMAYSRKLLLQLEISREVQYDLSGGILALSLRTHLRRNYRDHESIDECLIASESSRTKDVPGYEADCSSYDTRSEDLGTSVLKSAFVRVDVRHVMIDSLRSVEILPSR
jgi:hypothetical protein